MKLTATTGTRVSVFRLARRITKIMLCTLPLTSLVLAPQPEAHDSPQAARARLRSASAARLALPAGPDQASRTAWLRCSFAPRRLSFAPAFRPPTVLPSLRALAMPARTRSLCEIGRRPSRSRSASSQWGCRPARRPCAARSGG